MLPVAHVGAETSLGPKEVQIFRSLNVAVILCLTQIFLIRASTMNHKNFRDGFLHIGIFKQTL